uniref:Integrin beta n=1 Tax=Cairina moschata TaxID=8855 RepID=A0A8C3BTA6_CAIMO
MMQVALCQERIGWRPVTRLLVFASDDAFHTAGDGRLAGIVLPSDSRCHLDASGVYNRSHLYDYPSVGHLAQVLSAANIQPIFAVTRPTVPLYKELSRLIPKSVVGELRDDSSNVVQLITDAYNVTFTVRVRAEACLEAPQHVALRVLGVPEQLQLGVRTLCRCPCAQRAPHAPLCHGGDLDCGVCRCPGGRRGRRCECEGPEAEEEVWGGCRPPNSTAPPCSGRGHCVCGACECPPGLSGRFCECDSGACERHEGLPCGGGHGGGPGGARSLGSPSLGGVPSPLHGPVPAVFPGSWPCPMGLVPVLRGPVPVPTLRVPSPSPGSFSPGPGPVSFPRVPPPRRGFSPPPLGPPRCPGSRPRRLPSGPPHLPAPALRVPSPSPGSPPPLPPLSPRAPRCPRPVPRGGP